LLRHRCVSPRIASLFFLAALAACREAPTGAAERVTHTAPQTPRPLTAPPPPCRGCTVDVPRTHDSELPILVVLHGNHEHAYQRSAWWRDAATARGYVVLGLECPRDDGCTDGIWYRWNRAPSWIAEQIDALDLPIDRDRRYVAAWSGGASYIGMNADKLAGVFAAVVFHGGGQPPQGRDDCPSGALPSYFLVGDGNPAHPAAVRLKEYLAKCDEPLAWDLLPGAGHQAEAKALDREKADQILDWMERHTTSSVVASGT
jgi:poly(3-hydroxybutyrate) depolymerase